MQLSVIVPVYNGERYIAACLQSLISQWVEGVEIIVVNDGSNDGTEDIVDAEFGAALAQGYLRHIRTPNSGVSAARNLGLDEAKGEYVAFVDADDLVASNYLATILSATAGKPDMIEFGYRTIDHDDVPFGEAAYIHTRFGMHPIAKVRNAIFSACLWYPFVRVARRQLFATNRFPVGVRFCEDLMTFSKVYPCATTVISLPDVLYRYRLNPSGATLNVRSDYAPKLISFYRSILHEQSIASRMLKLSVAYAARQCLAKSTDAFGRLPQDIEADLRWLPLKSPTLLRTVRGRLIAYAVIGPLLYRIRRLACRVGIRRKNSVGPVKREGARERNA